MHRLARRLLIIAAAAWPLVGCTGLGAAVPLAGHTPLPAARGFIKHVVIIVQENRSMDNLFHGFPGADTASVGRTSSGATVALAPVSLAGSADPCHSHTCWLTTWDHARLDGFDRNNPPNMRPDYDYAYVPHSEIQPYLTLASRYVLADRMFQSNSGPSYPAHQYLIAAQSSNADENPLSPGVWGCDSPAGTTVALLGQNGRDVPGPFPCFDYVTLGDEMDRAGVTWRYYAPALTQLGAIWSAYDAIRHIRFGPDWRTNVISPETQILSDVQNGSLAQVTWVVPSVDNSDHPPSGNGPQWVASVVNAIGHSRFWNSTAIFITWDDWGGWYDHVVPVQVDRMGLGYRVPLLVVSPYAKQGYVSHVRHEFGSILNFTEALYALPPLSASDQRADNLEDCFDFRQSPRPFATVPTMLRAGYFVEQPPSRLPPDSD